MTTLKWVEEHIQSAINQDKSLEELRISLQSILTRLKISPLEKEVKEQSK